MAKIMEIIEKETGQIGIGCCKHENKSGESELKPFSDYTLSSDIMDGYIAIQWHIHTFLKTMNSVSPI